ncbi:MAG TPA: IS110 family transposase [Candidatus Krumholzibacteria bacterium]|nr:IS110 family transposase [Candidatus Krumholzibacteria bacterium]
MTNIIWVGLDVHQESITAAVLDGDRADADVVRLSGDLMKVRRLFRQLSQRGTVRACYEASGAGFVLHRTLARDGFSCDVIAPSLIPRKPGDRRKTDRLDAVMLAKLYRSGHLTPVHVPSPDQEALRRLLRLRYTYQCYAASTKHRISGILRTQGIVFREGKSTWTKTHRGWLAQLRDQLEGPLHIALAAELEHLEYLEMQRNSFDDEILRMSQASPYRLAVEALCCLRGVKTLTAMTLLCEIDDIRRFRSPGALMSFLGLVPSERSSGERERRGPITKAGNIHVRRLLVEAAWNNRHRCAADIVLKRRRQGQPAAVVAIAIKAQHRLSKKFWRLDQRKHRHVAITAVARELAGFIWAILHCVAAQA